MNERIEKLAEQAMDEMDPESFSEDVHIPTEWYQKFAELIVKECVDVANSKAEGIDLGSKLYLYNYLL